jgi:hypothetical protein
VNDLVSVANSVYLALQIMNLFRSLFLSLFLCWGLADLVAQNCNNNRYRARIFEPDMLANIVYGNAQELPLIYISEEITFASDLTMDVFLPVADELETRPCVILAYGGAYIFGSKEDEDIQSTCDSLARKGYVAVSINYRMGLNLLDENASVRAIYRAAQDFSAAVRYMKANADEYHIDPEYIFAGGVSAGGFSALHMAYMEENERPSATFGGGLFNTWPDLGCLDCSGNTLQETHEVRGIINLWGAIMDTEMMDESELVPQISFHGTEDVLVPYSTGAPFGATLLAPDVSGSNAMHNHITGLGGDSELNSFPGVGHNIWGVNVLNVLTPGPTEYWQPITDSIGSWLWRQIKPEAALISSQLEALDGIPVSITVSNAPENGYVCWDIEDGTILSASSDSSVVEVLWTGIGIKVARCRNINHLEAASEINEYEFQVSTPTDIDQFQSELAPSYYYVTDIRGRKVKQVNGSETDNLDLQPGVYILEWHLPNGLILKREKRFMQ